MKISRSITELPPLSRSARWVLPRRTALHWARHIHVAHRELDLTLCGRVRPGEELIHLLPDHPFCPRCLFRANGLRLM